MVNIVLSELLPACEIFYTGLMFEHKALLNYSLLQVQAKAMSSSLLFIEAIRH